MKKAAPIILILIGILLLYTSLQGRTGTLIASLLTPSEIIIEE